MDNKMYNKCDEQLLIIQSTFKANKQEAGEKEMKDNEQQMNND